MANRLRGRCGYPANVPFRVTVHHDRFHEPLHWKKPSRIFVCSMGDLFHGGGSSMSIRWVFETMARSARHTFCVLTKRPVRMNEWVRGEADHWPVWPLPNIWLGVSVEDQKAAYERIPILLQTPAALRFVSVEPMLASISLVRWLPITFQGPDRYRLVEHEASDFGPWRGLDWVICGGETGPGARPMHPDWARSLRDQCQAAGVPFFFKGWGDAILLPGGRDVSRLRGRKCRTLDDRTWDEAPEVTR
jgi:protein gp37